MSEQSVRRPVTVADGILMTKLGDRVYYRGGEPKEGVAQFSRDGEKFVVIVRRGNLEADVNEYSMLLWSTRNALKSGLPEVVLTMASSSNREAIQSVTWLADNETIVFLGEHQGEIRQLYRFNIRTRTVAKLTEHPTNIISYSITADGQQIAYTAEEAVTSIFDDKTRREGFIVPGQPWLSTLMAGQYRGVDELFFQSNATGNRPIRMSVTLTPNTGQPLLSPNGKYIAIVNFLRAWEVPKLWENYLEPTIQEAAKRKRLIVGKWSQYTNVSHYLLINTDSGQYKALLDSPIGPRSSQLVWSPNSQSAVVTGTFLPLNTMYPEDRHIRESQTYNVQVKVPGNEISIIGQDQVGSVTWDGNALVCEEDTLTWKQLGPRRKLCFQNADKGWKRVQCTFAEASHPGVVLEEDMNTPPKLFWVEPKSNRRELLMDLNPQFQNLVFAKVEEINWRGSDNHDVSGGLYYPRDYIPGVRYPLVIQTHGWTSHRFWIDGPYPTAFAAQAMARNGIVVLQVDEGPADDYANRPSEVLREVAAIEGAIDHLDREGLIDRARVGILGFSRTCLFVKYALSHSSYHFAAASVTDGADGGYFQYLVSYNGPGAGADRWFEGINAGVPFGKSLGLMNWIERSPGFNLDRVQTPLRITALNSGSLLQEWEWFVGLSRLDKPVELIYLQSADHILQKPWERMISQQGNVDWFVFWLKGEEDSDPAKSEQYARWRDLRKQQQANVVAAAISTVPSHLERACTLSLNSAKTSIRGTGIFLSPLHCREHVQDVKPPSNCSKELWDIEAPSCK